MKIKNLTPLASGVKPSSRRPPRPEVTLIVRGTFELVHGAAAALPEGDPLLVQEPLSAERHRPEDDALSGDIVYPGDFADFKPLADLLLLGTCHAPSGRPVASCPVRFAVGDFSKVLQVVGPRTWVPGVLGDYPSDPARFVKMPVAYTHAFGGPRHAANPVGKGLDTPELPNIESPGEPIKSRGDRPAPAGFGPLSPRWPERARKLGSAYGPEWRKERAPYHAEDFDVGHFNAAPGDQQVPFLRGDEALSFANLHPDRVLFESALPGLRVRAFLMDTTGRFREVPMVLDTLFADLDALRLSLVWRGVDAVPDAELRGVRTVLFASEPMASPREPEARYRAALEAFERDPVKESVPTSFGDPWAAVDPGPAAPEKPVDPRLAAQLDETLATLPSGLRAAIARAVTAGGAHTGRRGLDLPARVAAALANAPSPAAPPPAEAPLTDARIRPVLARRLAQLRGLALEARASGAAVPGLEALEAALRDPRLGGFPEGDPGAAKDADTPSRGGDSSGRDWSGRDLRGANLEGARLDGTLLARADLRGARLAGASLRQAVLAEAQLGDADLSGADLAQAQLARARARGARLTRARLDGVFAEEIDLEGADLEGVVAERALLQRASLTGARLAGAALTQCLFEGARLEESAWIGASLLRCMLTQIAGDRADFTDAKLGRSGFSDARLRRARFTGAQGPASVWVRADLTDADFRYSSFHDACFSEVEAAGARFSGADLRRARFDRARLEQASFDRANLFGVDLRRATLTRVSFRQASLFEAVLLGAAGSSADFAGANLTRALLDPS
ncbi:DUF2169 domain-containing protein [Sorangium sp. So ce281]|uniref:DUF2169 domain-containing protein n=1 Tax=Sorangium sp. So ce281 TaxID=3133293 RepID=UPI003F5FF2A4